MRLPRCGPLRAAAAGDRDDLPHTGRDDEPGHPAIEQQDAVVVRGPPADPTSTEWAHQCRCGRRPLGDEGSVAGYLVGGRRSNADSVRPSVLLQATAESVRGRGSRSATAILHGMAAPKYALVFGVDVEALVRVNDRWSFGCMNAEM